MKRFRILVLAVAALLLVCVFTGCSTSASAITVTLTLKTSADAEPYFSQDIKINAEAPTVELVVNEANATYPDLGITWTDLGALNLPDYPDKMNEDGSFDYWACLVDDVEPTGKAKDTAVKDGSVIVYTYTHDVPEVTETAE